MFIAHDLSVVRHMCDRVAVMYLGKIVEIAPSDALYRFPRHPTPARCSPPSRSPSPSGGRERKRQLLTGDVPSPANPPRACRFHTRCPKAQELCSQDEPLLELKGTRSLTACHFPLTESEVRDRLGAALAGSGPNGASAEVLADQSSSSSSST